jgi:hypothetical protein
MFSRVLFILNREETSQAAQSGLGIYPYKRSVGIDSVSGDYGQPWLPVKGESAISSV